MGYAAGRGIQIKIAQAALEAGVKRFYPWQFGVDYDIIGKGSAQDLFDEQIDVRQLLGGQNKTSWLIISTGMFMSFLFEEWFRVVEGLKTSDLVVRALGSWDNRVTVTSVEDIAKITARLVVDEPEIRNQVVFTAGQTISYGELTETVEKVMGVKAKREVLELSLLKEKLEKEPDNTICKYQVLFGEGRGVAWDIEKTYNWQKGIPTTSVEQWLRRALLRVNAIRPAKVRSRDLSELAPKSHQSIQVVITSQAILQLLYELQQPLREW